MDYDSANLIAAGTAIGQSSNLTANTLDPSFDHYIEYLRSGFWQAKNLPIQQQPDLIVQVDLSGLMGSDSATQLADTRAAMAVWSSTMPITFEEVTEGSPFDIKFTNTDSGAYFDSYSKIINVNKYWNSGSGGFSLGRYGFQSIIHEIGHALGLGHGGSYNALGIWNEEFNYDRSAEYTYDSWQYSIMSYFSPSQAHHSPYDYFLTTPRIADIEALSRKYFMNTSGVFQQVSANTSNDVYGFGGKSGFALAGSGYLHNVGFTIHDTGGWDSLDFSGSTTGTTLNLNPGAFSSVNGFFYNVSIYNGHNTNQTDYFIEIGAGSAFNDFITGNEGRNGLYGNAGDDWMSANGGNDVLIGWIGNDAMDGGNGDDFLDSGPDNDVLYGGSGNDQLYGGAGNDVLNGGLGWDRFEGGTGADTFQFTNDIEYGVTEAIADFTAGQDIFALSSTYIGRTFVQDTSNGVMISVPVGNGYWNALIYGTRDVLAVQHSFSYA
ncbi:MULTISPECIES: M10 family metallopeptidase C-terminal domain-containing protein [unclassified Phyllobacterium]|uniref:M10 family metallopeptidase C-terminal domain-containing protein n=1 Tax=unclassified Phyllobacterium TaxID=2638441 RepID=UPI003012F8AA